MKDLSAAVLIVLALGTVSACGSDDAGGSAQAVGTSATAGEQGGPLGADGSQFAAIQQCLEAAGLSDALPTGGPAGGLPSGAPPSGKPSREPKDTPSGAPGGVGGVGAAFDDPEIVAALTACGIALPSRRAVPSEAGSG